MLSANVATYMHMFMHFSSQAHEVSSTTTSLLKILTLKYLFAHCTARVECNEEHGAVQKM